MLKAGFARLDITPPFGCPLDGYFNARTVKGVLDPIELNAIALNDGEKTLVMIASDVLGVYIADIKHIKSLITSRTAIPENYILISALHQHTSFRLQHKETGHLPQAYAEVLYAKYADVAQMAIDDMKEASLSTAEKETEEPIAFVRRYRTSDGKFVTNPRPHQIPLLIERCAEADNTVRLLRFHREGGNDIVLVNFSTHPDVVHGEKVSADWPGFVRRFVEADHKDTSCLFFTGAQGDSNHIDFMGVKRDGYDHSRHMGRVIANAVSAVWDDTTPRTADKLFACIKVIYNKSNTNGEEKYEECKAFEVARLAGKLDYTPTMEQYSFARRVVEIRESMTIYRPLPVTVVGIGEVVIVGFGGEPFTEYGASAREATGGRFTLTFCATNGYQGYLPSAKAFSEGGYEAAGSRFTPNLQTQAIGAVKEMLEEMDK